MERKQMKLAEAFYVFLYFKFKFQHFRNSKNRYKQYSWIPRVIFCICINFHDGILNSSHKIQWLTQRNRIRWNDALRL